jgi:hypothetical protein
LSSPIRLFTINNWFALQKLSNIFPYLFLVLSIFLRLSGILYIPPEYTRYSSDEAFNQIEHELHSFSTNSKYVGLIGDINSRTGEDDDYVNSHSFSNIWTWFTKFSLNPNSIPPDLIRATFFQCLDLNT